MEAGAVAAAREAKIRAKGLSNLSTLQETKKTRREANRDSKRVIITTITPFFFRVSKRKNSPVLKAIKASAISAIKSIPSMIEDGITLREKGPRRIPARIYAVTFGNLIFFVNLVNKKPEKSIKEIEAIILDTESVICNSSKRGVVIILPKSEYKKEKGRSFGLESLFSD